MDPSTTPVAHAVHTLVAPLGKDALERLSAPYVTRSLADRFLGPAWVSETGAACIVLVTGNARWVNHLKEADRCGALCWRWNNQPSTFFSLTLLGKERIAGEAVRWMRPSEDPVVQAIRRHGQFFMCVTLPSGRSSGWFEATFRPQASGTDDRPLEGLEYLWSFPTPGIPFSNVGERFDPNRTAEYNEHRSDEISLWPEPVSDFWTLMAYDGPWAADLTTRDRARAAWGNEAFRHRCRAAGRVQVLIEQQRLDGKPTAFDRDGQLARPEPTHPEAIALLREHPKIAHWFSTVAGPQPSARDAHEAVLAVLRDPAACFAAVSRMRSVLDAVDDENFGAAVEATFSAAFMDPEVTQMGTCRPWLANTGYPRLELKASQIDLDAPLDDINNLWRSGFELIDLSDFPVPFETLCEGLSNVQVESSIEEADEQVNRLLREAQDARQWSIPWGARVEVSFGPFVAVRIFEKEGEFSCHFLDEQDRYFHVAIGLGGPNPRAATMRLIRKRPEDGELTWNTDAEAALKLIAAAIVRDFLVVEEREGIFSARHFTRRIRGHDIKTVIYLPRVRYSLPRATVTTVHRPSFCAFVIQWRHIFDVQTCLPPLSASSPSGTVSMCRKDSPLCDRMSAVQCWTPNGFVPIAAGRLLECSLRNSPSHQQVLDRLGLTLRRTVRVSSKSAGCR